MSVVSHGNNWAGESANVDAGVLSPLGRPKVVAMLYYDDCDFYNLLSTN